MSHFITSNVYSIIILPSPPSPIISFYFQHHYAPKKWDITTPICWTGIWLCCTATAVWSFWCPCFWDQSIHHSSTLYTKSCFPSNVFWIFYIFSYFSASLHLTLILQYLEWSESCQVAAKGPPFVTCFPVRNPASGQMHPYVTWFAARSPSPQKPRWFAITSPAPLIFSSPHQIGLSTTPHQLSPTIPMKDHKDSNGGHWSNGATQATWR